MVSYRPKNIICMKIWVIFEKSTFRWKSIRPNLVQIRGDKYFKNVTKLSQREPHFQFRANQGWQRFQKCDKLPCGAHVNNWIHLNLKKLPMLTKMLGIWIAQKWKWRSSKTFSNFCQANLRMPTRIICVKTDRQCVMWYNFSPFALGTEAWSWTCILKWNYDLIPISYKI